MRLFRAYLDLGKIRLSLLVAATTLAGYLLGSYGSLAGPLGWTLLGTLLSALGANGLNQWLERDRDARMQRTQRRPLPSGKLTPTQAYWLALASAMGGLLILGWQVNLLTAALSLLTVLLYVLVYTPLKVHSPSCTLIGALVGALPPLMGWSAATGQLGYGALALAAILFVWQIPHFLGLAWMYRDDYAAGGFRMLPVVERDGQLTALLMMVYSVALIPVALLLVVGGVSGWQYGLGAIALGGAMIAVAWGFYFERTASRARLVFVASLLYLPALMALMIWNVTPQPEVYIRTNSAAGQPVFVGPLQLAHTAAYDGVAAAAE